MSDEKEQSIKILAEMSAQITGLPVEYWNERFNPSLGMTGRQLTPEEAAWWKKYDSPADPPTKAQEARETHKQVDSEDSQE